MDQLVEWVVQYGEQGEEGGSGQGLARIRRMQYFHLVHVEKPRFCTHSVAMSSQTPNSRPDIIFSRFLANSLVFSSSNISRFISDSTSMIFSWFLAASCIIFCLSEEGLRSKSDLLLSVSSSMDLLVRMEQSIWGLVVPSCRAAGSQRWGSLRMRPSQNRLQLLIRAASISWQSPWSSSTSWSRLLTLRAMRLPLWVSACTKPSLWIILMIIFENSLPIFFMSILAFLRFSISSMWIPSMNSITSTRLVGFSASCGTQMSLSPFSRRKFSVRFMFCASRLKSSSMRMFFSKPSTSHSYLKSVNAHLASRTNPRSMARSDSTWPARCLCWILTATFWPLSRTALWTCPMEAEEMGYLSNDLKTTSRGYLSSSSTVAFTSSKGAFSHSLVRAPMTSRYSSGTMTSREAMSCPSLRQMPPLALRASLRYQLARVFLRWVGWGVYLQMQVMCAAAQARLERERKELLFWYWQHPMPTPSRQAVPIFNIPRLILAVVRLPTDRRSIFH